MSYTVEILRRAEKALRDLTDRKLYHRLREAIDVLASEPRPHGCTIFFYLTASLSSPSCLFGHRGDLSPLLYGSLCSAVACLYFFSGE